MDSIRLHEGELNVMEMIWSNEEVPAKDIAKIVKEYVGWEKNTTYTVISRLIDKGAVARIDPGFICKSKISKSQVQNIEVKFLLDKLFQGSLSNFFKEYLKEIQLTQTELMELQKIINEQESLIVKNRMG